MVVLVEGLPTDPSGASSAWAVASRSRGKHTGVSVCPDVVCYLTLHGATQHANRFQPLFGKRGGIKCHIAGTVLIRCMAPRIDSAEKLLATDLVCLQSKWDSSGGMKLLPRHTSNGTPD